MVFECKVVRAIFMALITVVGPYANVLAKLPSIQKHKAYFVNQLSQDMYPIWFPNRIPMKKSEDYPGNQISQVIKTGILTGKPLPENYTPYYVLNHLLTVTKYHKVQGKALIRDSEMLDLLFDGLKIKDENIRFRVQETITEYLHPDLKVKMKNKILKRLAIRSTDYEQMAKWKIPFSEIDKAVILKNPAGYSEYVRFIAGDEILRKETEDTLLNAKDIGTFAHNAKLLVDADPIHAAPILFKKINDPIYDSKDTGASTKHVRSIIINLLGLINPDSRLLNDDYELCIQYGEAYESSIQKKRISTEDIRHYIEMVIQWGTEKYGIKPDYPLEPKPFIERKNFPKEPVTSQEKEGHDIVDPKKKIEIRKDQARDSSMIFKSQTWPHRMRAFKMEKGK